MSTNRPRAPLIAVVGSTGTGKSQLAVDIACRFNGEIINGDAIQLYEGLPIITNKIPEGERQGIPHHLLGCIGLNEQTWTVADFVASALRTIQEIRSRGKLPILVGGTHYYTQSLLFNDVLAMNAIDGGETEKLESGKTWPILDGPIEDMIAKLREVDPTMADRWHPNDGRKIRRSLEIWFQTGRRASDIYREQRQQREVLTDELPSAPGVSQDVNPRSSFRMDTLVLWANAESEELSERLDSRVDKMLKDGLLAEVDTLARHAEKQAALGEEVDISKGIWVAIGFKEFLDYYKAKQESAANEHQMAALMESSKDKTKAATRQYAKRQVRWIRIKLNHAINTAGGMHNFFVLDGSDLTTWAQTVSAQGLELVESFLAGKGLPDPATLSSLASELLAAKRPDISASVGQWSRQHCDTCNMTAVTEKDWTQHLTSRRHRQLTRKKAKGQDLQKMRQRSPVNDDS